MEIEEPIFYEKEDGKCLLATIKEFIFDEHMNKRNYYDSDENPYDCFTQYNSQNSTIGLGQLNEEQQDKKKKKKRRTNANKQKEINKIGFSFITHKMLTQDVFTIYPGLSVTSDGSLRLCYSLSQVSFGFQSQDLTTVEELKGINSIHLRLTPDHSLQKFSVGEALDIVKKASGDSYNKMKDILLLHEYRLSVARKQLKEANLTQELLDQKDKDYMIYQDYCQKYLEEYSIKHPYQMYQYVVGRFNFKFGEVDIFQCGYSKSYIQFLGLDLETFINMTMRQQQIDLIYDKDQIIDQSILGLQSFMGNVVSEDEIFISDITTFDGFKIKLIQRKIQVKFPNDANIDEKYLKGNIFYIREMDVDTRDLQRLIEYRQRIASNKLSLNEFVEKEMSYLFEDVEYSVHAQSFLEKYYPDNLQKLQQIAEKKKYTCGYRVLSQTDSTQPSDSSSTSSSSSPSPSPHFTATSTIFSSLFPNFQDGQNIYTNQRWA